MLLWIHVKKELLLLSRDRAGLLVLFVMPMMLVLVLSLIQDNLFRTTGATAIEALFVNLDRGSLGEELGDQLQATGGIRLIPLQDGEKARQLVYDGDYQFAILVPEGFSQEIRNAAAQTMASLLGGEQGAGERSRLTLYFDPTIRGLYRTALTSILQRGVLVLEIAEKSDALQDLLPEQLQPGEGSASSAWASRSLVEVAEESAYPDRFQKLPTSVQQNVPAWTLFGMFFIVIPLAGTLIQERQEGTLTRLLTMPVTGAGLLFGKVGAYLCVCLTQCCLMLLVGTFILPLLGTPELELGAAPLALVLVGFSGALAACGFGILVGVLARSYEQASTFGAVSVVIAAAMGGVMVPVYVMPGTMQALSILSPLNWGLEAFLDIFVRNGGLVSVMPHILALTCFFLVCISFALLVFHRRRRGL